MHMIMDNQLKELSRKLKATCTKFRENKLKEKNIKESAKILHQLGKVYRKIADTTEEYDQKVALIRSAALFNAAIVRKPNNIAEVQNDLREVCSHALQLAGAKILHADLIKKAKVIHKRVIEMRTSVANAMKTSEEYLKQDKKRKERNRFVARIELLNEEIQSIYTSLMRDIMKYCVRVIGRPPCKYALVGMGSLSRKEITPYSDFEHIYVLEEGVQLKTNYKKKLPYFRWLAVIFQLVIINIGETNLPQVSLPHINDNKNKSDNWFYDAHTTKGISFDGMVPYACKHPLGFPGNENKGKVELIKPISRMAKYLEKGQNLKNGYHLADMLANTSFVSGFHSVYSEFRLEVERVLLNQNAPGQLFPMVKEDLEQFHFVCSVCQTLDRVRFDLKRVFYRTVTVFISSLGRRHGITACSSNEILQKLTKIIGRKMCEEIKYAVAIACAVRLYVYSNAHRQDNEECMTDVLNFLGEENVCSFFKSAAKLQNFILKEFSVGSKFECKYPEECTAIMFFLSCGFLEKANLIIQKLYGMGKMWNFLWLHSVTIEKRGCFTRDGPCLQSSCSCTGFYYTRVCEELISYVACLGAAGGMDDYETECDDLRTLLILNIACRYGELGIYESARSYIALLPNEYNVQNQALKRQFSKTLSLMGINLYEDGMFKEAKCYFKRELKCRLSEAYEGSQEVSDCYNYLAHCYHKLDKPKKAYNCFEKIGVTADEGSEVCKHYVQSLYATAERRFPYRVVKSRICAIDSLCNKKITKKHFFYSVACDVASFCTNCVSTCIGTLFLFLIVRSLSFVSFGIFKMLFGVLYLCVLLNARYDQRIRYSNVRREYLFSSIMSFNYEFNQSMARCFPVSFEVEEIIMFVIFARVLPDFFFLHLHLYYYFLIVFMLWKIICNDFSPSIKLAFVPVRGAFRYFSTFFNKPLNFAREMTENVFWPCYFTFLLFEEPLSLLYLLCAVSCVIPWPLVKNFFWPKVRKCSWKS